MIVVNDSLHIMSEYTPNQQRSSDSSIRVSVPDPDSIRSVDPDSESGSRSGFRRAKITHKNIKNLEISCFVLDVLIRGLKASSVAWTSFMEA
jgi:hypothetical protein